jgi:predicted TIM-barrel fold metal-dependent hydrolase
MKKGSGLYDGPIIDAHTHLWDLSMNCHGWLTEANGISALGSLETLRRDVTVETFRYDCGNQPIVASVHIEALWDPAEPVGETRWLETLDKSSGVALRYTAAAPLGTPRGPAILEQQAAFARVIGIRQILSFHPTRPEKSFAPHGDIALDPAWQRDVARVASLGLMLEVMMYPYQLDQVVALARKHPGLQIILNHCASPIDRDASGMERWRRSVTELAAEPNIAIKVSNAAAYDPEPTDESLRAVMRHCVESFGPARTMLASDWPVAGLNKSYNDIYNDLRRAVADLTPAEQRALFHDNAAKYYRI